MKSKRTIQPRWTAADMPDLRGKTAIVTGASSGVGFEIARELAAHGAQVVLASRDLGRTEQAADRIRTTTPDARVERTGDHPHAAFKQYRLVGVAGDVVTIDAEVYNPDGTAFRTTLRHRLEAPNRIESTMSGGTFDGARFVHVYTPAGEATVVSLEGEFPALPGMTEAEEIKMLDAFFATACAEDAATIRTWSLAAV